MKTYVCAHCHSLSRWGEAHTGSSCLLPLQRLKVRSKDARRAVHLRSGVRCHSRILFSLGVPSPPFLLALTPLGPCCLWSQGFPGWLSAQSGMTVVTVGT